MTPRNQFCPNVHCHASGRISGRNIVIHSRQQRRYKCTCCGRTFSETHGTSVYRLKKPAELFVLVVTLLVHGCPVQAIVAAFGLDERTVHDWLCKAGKHAQRVHEQMVSCQELNLEQAQGDEIRVKTQGGVLWMALAVMVSTRLWLGGVVSAGRDMRLAQKLAAQVRCVALERPLLLAVDGWKSYVRAFRLAFRTPVRDGRRGRPRLKAWHKLAITQVVKRRQGKALSIERRIVQGGEELVTHLLHRSQHGGLINTAYIERLNATFRQRFSCLARRAQRYPAPWHAPRRPSKAPCSCLAVSTISVPSIRPCPTPRPPRRRWLPISPTMFGRSTSCYTSSRRPPTSSSNGVADHPKSSVRVALSDHLILWSYPVVNLYAKFASPPSEGQAKRAVRKV